VKRYLACTKRQRAFLVASSNKDKVKSMLGRLWRRCVGLCEAEGMALGFQARWFRSSFGAYLRLRIRDRVAASRVLVCPFDCL